MEKLMRSWILVIVLVLGCVLYLGQTRDLNAAGSLSVEEMGKIRAGGCDNLEAPQCGSCYELGSDCKCHICTSCCGGVCYCSNCCGNKCCSGSGCCDGQCGLQSCTYRPCDLDGDCTTANFENTDDGTGICFGCMGTSANYVCSGPVTECLSSCPQGCYDTIPAVGIYCGLVTKGEYNRNLDTGEHECLNPTVVSSDLTCSVPNICY